VYTYRRVTAKGKRNTVVITAITREIAAFLWAIAREVEPASVTPQKT
jgi:transposase